MARERPLKNSKFKTKNPNLSASPRRLKPVVLGLLVFIWPILYLFSYVFPINGKYTAIGNDFISLYFWHKVYLLANLSQFHLPLWSPSEAAGFPFYTNPFTQACYPFNIVLTTWYEIAGGYGPLDQQIFTVLGLSILALGLFMWLKLINKNIRAVLFAVLVMSVSFKITETTRFPNAVHSAAWYPWILYAITAIFFSKSIRAAIGFGILLCFSLICLCTGGYPYFAYYSQFLFVPYLLVFLIKPLRVRLIGQIQINWKRAIISLVLAGTAAGLICSPYILGVRHLVAQATDRGGMDYAYSTEHTFTITDTIGSLVYPPAASTEGWYFFSITALLIIIVYMFARKSSLWGDDADFAPCNLTSKVFFLIWFGIITYITYGRDSYLFDFLWKYLPGFSRLRIWPRLNIILVPIIAWLLSLAYARFESLLVNRTSADEGKKSKTLSLILILTAAYAVILAAQLFFLLNNTFHNYWLEYFKHLTPLRVKFITHGIAGFVCILAFVFFAGRVRAAFSRYAAAMLVILLAAAIFEMRPVAVRIWTYEVKTPQTRFKIDMNTIMANAFSVPRTDVYRTVTLTPAFNVGVIDNWYFDRYCRFLKNTRNEQDARKALLGVYDGTRVFFSDSIQHPTVTSFLNDAIRYRTMAGRLIYYSGEELNWEIDAPVNGYLSFIDNWEQGWKCFVDDKPAEIELLFGTFKSVHLAAGKHNVRFCYQPALLQW
jgi:hypothetical protein